MRIAEPYNLLTRSFHSSLTTGQLQMDALGGQFIHESSDYGNLLSMAVGSALFKASRCAFLSMGMLRPFASFSALGFEATGFRATSNLLSAFRSQEAKEDVFNAKGWWGTFLNFGALKAIGSLAEGANIFARHALQSSAMVATQQTAARLGLAPAPEGSFLQQLLHAEASNIAMEAGSKVMAFANAYRLNLLERVFELRSASILSWENVASSRHARLIRLNANETHPFMEDPVVVRHRQAVLELTHALYENLPERFALFCYTLEYLQRTFRSAHDKDQLKGILAFVEYKHLVDPISATQALKERRGLSYIESLHQASPAEGYDYLSRIFQVVPLVSLYVARLADPREWTLADWNADPSILTHRVNCYLAERAKNPGQDAFASMIEAMKKSLQEEGILLAEREDHHAIHVSLSGNLLKLLDFVFRNLTHHFPGLSDRHASASEKYFPSEVPVFARERLAPGEAITWEEIEAIRRSRLPALSEGENPTILIVGMGRDLKQARRYLERGYQVILLDQSPGAEEAYLRVQGELEAFAEKHHAKIAFHREDITRPGADFLNLYRGRAHSIEYQYVNGLSGEDHPSLVALLKRGGVFVEYFPQEIHRESLLPLGFREILRRRNVGQILGTFSENTAYPIGCHVAIFQFSGEGEGL